jgi:hypothetical protein
VAGAGEEGEWGRIEESRGGGRPAAAVARVGRGTEAAREWHQAHVAGGRR